MADSPELERLRKARAALDAEMRRLESDAEQTLDMPSPPPSGATPTLVRGPALETPAPEALSVRYEVLEEIGRGGMGIVYRARDRETQEVVAVKVLRPEIAANAAMMERFKSELRLARQITHKHVCRIHDFNRFGDVACISMEVVEGESLRRVLTRVGPLSLRTSLKVAAQVCAAMREAHQQGIVHRDLKPENVMLDSAGDVKVMDFGIAHSVKHGTGEGVIAGTPAYMSPEQAKGEATDARADVYAIGLILYEMLTGQPTFAGDTTTELIEKHVKEPPRAPREIEPSIPPHLERIVLRCLEKDPEGRFQSAGDLEAALRAEAPAELLAEYEIEVPPRLRQWGRWDSALAVLGVAGMALALTYYPKVLPSAIKLEVDAIAARREALNTSRRFGFNPWQADARLEYRSEWYRYPLAQRLVRRMDRVASGDSLMPELPLLWRVELRASLSSPLTDEPEATALVTRTGKVIEYSRQRRQAETFIPGYQPPPIERRREIAGAALRDLCGDALPNVRRIETSGDEWNARYTAVWRPLHPAGGPPLGRVTLWAEKPIYVRCAEDPDVWDWGGAAFPATVLQGVLQGVARVFSALFVLLPLLVWFVMGRCHTSPTLIRRAPLALLCGFCGAWLMLPLFSGVPLPVPILVGAPALALLLLIGFLAVEHRLGRVRPRALATWRLAWRGKVLDPAIGMAVLRGTLAGLALLGVQIVIGLLAESVQAGRWGFQRLLMVLLLGLPDPEPAGLAAARISPAFHAAAASLFTAALVGFIGVGFAVAAFHKFLGDSQREKKRRWLGRWGPFGFLPGLYSAAAFPALLALALGLPVGRTVGIALAFLAVPYLLAGLTILVMLAYDLFTATVTIGFLALATVTCPLLFILSDTGNGGAWALLAAWAAVVMAATIMAFRPAIAARLRRVRAEMR